MQILQLQGKEQQLYQLLAPLVMDPNVIRANNNYPFKTNDNYIWFVAVEDGEVIGFVPVERKSSKKAIINNYYVAATDAERREEVLSSLLAASIDTFTVDDWLLTSVTLVQDKGIFEKFDFEPTDEKLIRYVKMIRR